MPRGYCYRCEFRQEYPECDLLCVDYIRTVIKEETSGRVAGIVLEPIQGPDAKLETLLQLTATRGIGPEDTVAVGDGANDLPLLGTAGLGVAYRAHAHVAKAAQIAIVHGNLTALLYLQGIARTDFVATRRSTDQLV